MSAGYRQPDWLTVFVDFPAAEFAAGVEFWAAATGYRLSPLRGEHREFASLLPSAGTEYLRVQRLGAGSTRVHLDVHVAEPSATAELAERLGAELIAESPHGYWVLRSPAGLTFCVVRSITVDVPGASRWASGHRSRISEVCLDVPRSQHVAEVRFWEALLGGSWRSEGGVDDLARRDAGDEALALLLQPVDLDNTTRGHLHVWTDDREAEVARLVATGARLRAIRETWTVLEAPGGMGFCVVDVATAALR